MADRSEVQCPCCGLFYSTDDLEKIAPYAVPLDPRSGVCWGCVQHSGDGDAMRMARGRQHGKMLRRAYVEEREETAAAEQEVEEMRRDLNMRPMQTLIRIENLDQIVVDVAREERDDAYRRRDTAMGALSDVRVLHHKQRDDKTRCECGLLYDKCDVARLVDRWDGVLRWERTESGKAHRGQRHRLMPDHPALTDNTYWSEVYEG